MTFSRQPPVTPAAGDLLNDFDIRQAAGQAVVDIRFEAGDPGAARRENFTVAEKDRRRILRQYLIQLVVDRLTFLDVEKRKPIYHQLYQVLAQDPPAILLGYREILSASSARVTGFKPDIYNGLTGSLPDVKIVK